LNFSANKKVSVVSEEECLAKVGRLGRWAEIYGDSMIFQHFMGYH